MKELFDKGVKVTYIGIWCGGDTPTGKLVFSVMSAFAEFERDLIVERTQKGKAIVRQRDDFMEGRPSKYRKKQIKRTLQLLESNSYKQVEDKTNNFNITLLRAKKNKSDA